MVNKENLVGKKINKIEKITENELEQIFYFPERNTDAFKILLESGKELIPSKDEEGNQAGYLFLQEELVTKENKNKIENKEIQRITTEGSYDKIPTLILENGLRLRFCSSETGLNSGRVFSKKDNSVKIYNF